MNSPTSFRKSCQSRVPIQPSTLTPRHPPGIPLLLSLWLHPTMPWSGNRALPQSHNPGQLHETLPSLSLYARKHRPWPTTSAQALTSCASLSRIGPSAAQHPTLPCPQCLRRRMNPKSGLPRHHLLRDTSPFPRRLTFRPNIPTGKPTCRPLNHRRTKLVFSTRRRWRFRHILSVQRPDCQ